MYARFHLVTILSALVMVPGNQTLHAQGSDARPGVRGLDLRNATHVGIGYVANIPATFLGLSAFVVSPKILGGMGFYADFKQTTRSPSKDPYYMPNITVTDAEVTYGDQLFVEKSDWVTVNAALLYAVTREVALYGGLGYAREKHFRQYFDASGTRGEFGYYWVSDPDQSGTRINVMGGGLIRMTRFLLFQLGAEMHPAGANVGLAITFRP